MTEYEILWVKFDSYESKKAFERHFSFGTASTSPKVLVNNFSHGTNSFGEDEGIYFMKDFKYKKFIYENDESILFLAQMVINNINSKWKIIKGEMNETKN